MQIDDIYINYMIGSVYKSYIGYIFVEYLLKSVILVNHGRDNS